MNQEEFTGTEDEAIYRGHFDLVNIDKLTNMKVFMLGAGSIGSFAAISMAKMGIINCSIVDFDSVEIHNQANQIYNWHQAGKLKISCLKSIIDQYSKNNWNWNFTKDKLDTIENVSQYANGCNIIISAVDNMDARQLLFNYCIEKASSIDMFIDARIGAVQSECYAIQPFMPEEVEEFTKNNLDNSSTMPDIKCTEKSIIFPVMWTSSWITSCLYHIANGTQDQIPFCIDINFNTWNIFKDERPQ